MPKAECKHCKNLNYKSKMIKCATEDIFFCCNGCKSVYFLLKESNIENTKKRKSKKSIINSLKRYLKRIKVNKKK